MKVKLLKDIIIPAGTIFNDAPTKTTRCNGHVECLVGLTDDSCGSFVYDMLSDKENISEWFEEC